MPAAGPKGAPKNPRELKDDTSSSREEKQVTISLATIQHPYIFLHKPEFPKIMGTVIVCCSLQ